MVTAVPAYPDLSGKVAVVTGGSRGIGAATVAALARNGVAVAAVARDQQALGVSSPLSPKPVGGPPAWWRTALRRPSWPEPSS